MAPPIPIFEINDPPDDLIATLTSHSPYALPLLRRLELLHKPGYQTPHSHIIASFKGQDASLPFIAAHLDFSHGPDTEMWLFSSLELPSSSHIHTPKEQELAEQQILSLFEKVNEIETREGKKRSEDGSVGARVKEVPCTVLIGSLHEKVLGVLKRNEKIAWSSETHQKLLFEGATLPRPIALPSPDLRWIEIDPSHIPLIISRATVARRPHAIPLWPSLAIFDAATTSTIAWAFIGFDGSLKGIHVEEQFRRRGLGKITALQLLRNNLATFSGGWGHADVAVSNAASLGTCASLGGKNAWFVYWALVKTGS